MTYLETLYLHLPQIGSRLLHPEKLEEVVFGWVALVLSGFDIPPRKPIQLFFASKTMKAGGRATHLLVASNRFKGKEALVLYRMRWGIERLFGHLKKNSFDLEATHMSDPRKLEKLFAVGDHRLHDQLQNDPVGKL